MHFNDEEFDNLLQLYNRILQGEENIKIPKTICVGENTWTVKFFKSRHEFSWSNLNCPDSDVKEYIYMHPIDKPFLALETEDRDGYELTCVVTTNGCSNMAYVDGADIVSEAISFNQFFNEFREKIRIVLEEDDDES